MNTGKSHLVASIPARKIFTVSCLICKFSLKLRDRNIFFPCQKRRIGKWPDIFGTRQSADRIADLTGIGLQSQDCSLGRGFGTCIDIRLIFRKVARYMAVIRERMRCLRHRGILIHTQSLFLKTEFPLQKTLSDFRRFYMEH